MTTWPPDYVRTIAWRINTIKAWRRKPHLLVGARQYYQDNYIQFIEDWIDTIDPRNSVKGQLTRMPFILFPRQRELVSFFHSCVTNRSHGLVEKSRDMGATWASISYAVWLWLFQPGSSIGFGSRKAQLVDRIGDLDSIFEKIRRVVASLPPELRPPTYTAAYMKLVNHENGASITGESGDEIGRGGRKTAYFKDESSHYDHPEAIEAALSENTDVQIDISSVNGVGNVFHRRREAGIDWSPGMKMAVGRTYVFVLDWRDHPAKDLEWYQNRKQKFVDDGLSHVFAQEVDRNYSATIVNTLIRKEWFDSAIDAHLKMGVDPDVGSWFGGLDVADSEGGDRNAIAKRRSIILRHVDEWGERDTGATARRAIEACNNSTPIHLSYDSVGVGSGVKAEFNRLNEDNLLPKGVKFSPWNAGSGVLNPEEHVIVGDEDSPTNGELYDNLKAQAWIDLARRFERTHNFITREIRYDPDELISIDGNLPKLRQLEKELLQVTANKNTRMKWVVNKAPNGARSPNIADAVVMCYFPIMGTFDTSMGWL